MQDQPPPHTARVLRDAQIEIRAGHSVDALAQPSTQRLLVLNSHALDQIAIGQTITLHMEDHDPMQVVVESVDHSSLILRYAMPPES